MKNLLLACFLCFAIASSAQTTLYVDGSVTASGVGTTWSKAFKTLNEALNAANSGSSTTKYEIDIAKGTYFPTGVNTGTKRDSTFMIARGRVKILGGFPKGGGIRDAVKNPVILSGEIGATRSSDNSYHVMTISGVTSSDTIIVDGLSLTGGYADGSGSKNIGAGLSCANNSCTILISNCQFTKNQAPSGQGGAIYFAQSGAILNTYFYKCTITGNAAAYGGGFYQNGVASISNCSFLSNNASNGAGLYGVTPGASIISGSVFSGNSATSNGAGMYSFNATSSFRIFSCLFSGNSAGTGGGGLCDSASSPFIENCTFAADTAPSGNAILNVAASTLTPSNPVVINSIIWEGATNGILDAVGNTTNVTNSIVEGGYAGKGNSATDPFFVKASTSAAAPTTSGNYRLYSSCSPAANIGATRWDYADTTDADGNPRLFDTYVDLGAFEFQSLSPLKISTISVAESDTICVGTTNTFTVSTTDGGPTPAIAWTVNGLHVGSGTSFTSSTLADGDTVIVSMVSSQFCTSTLPVEDTLIMKVLAPVAPTVTISASAGNQICSGTLDTFSVNVTAGGTAPAFTWMVNGIAVSSDSSFATSSLSQGDTVSVVMSSSHKCASPATAADTIYMTVFPVAAAPTVTSTTITYCLGTTASALTAIGSNGTASNLNWYTVATGGTPSTTAPTPNTTAADTLNFWVSEPNAYGCESPRAQITVYVLPVPGKPSAAATNPVCVGDTLFLTATTTATSTSFSWTGPGFSSTDQNPFIASVTPAAAGKYWLTVSQYGCVSEADTVFVNMTCLDSVWAGDANFDKLVDNRDALEIALNMGASGPARASSSIVWQAALAPDWATMLTGNASINGKHADCDGDGSVAFADTLAVAQNYGSTHSKEYHVPANKTTGVPDLYFDHSGNTLTAGQTVTVRIKLGSSAMPMKDFAGIAAHIKVDGVTPAAAPQLTYSSSWLGSGSNTLHFSKTINNGQVDWAYARIDKQNRTGSGTIALMTFTIPAGSGGQVMRLYFDDVKLVNSNGAEILDYNVLDDTFTVAGPPTTGISTTANQNFGVQLIPNPSVGPCNAVVTLPVSGMFNLEIRDLSGKLIWQTSGNGKAGQQSIALPVEKVNSGVYLINLQQAGQSGVTVRWMRG